ncbi:hypothetical protein [Deinococcus yavapaiensis]|uniref:Uncharacterized protein n=1 Tax=Deinococcus yavapaiensis KR-236 TaxID=694435 RepID=A0A318SDY8_9DEIO|nr:hypothetical protein [Deinococcus yavapaiensis]PYE54732.1 hypothetical protein DES52_1042 [Deinococcus yavapaiensis KR-236]
MNERFDVRVARAKVRASRRSLTNLLERPGAPDDLVLQARLAVERAEDEWRHLAAQVHLEVLLARHREEELVLETHALTSQSEVWREKQSSDGASPRERLEAEMRFLETSDLLSAIGAVPSAPEVPEPTWQSTARDAWVHRADHHPVVREAVRALEFTRWMAEHAPVPSARVAARASVPRRTADLAAAREGAQRWMDEQLERLREWRASYEVAAAHVRARTSDTPSERVERTRAATRALQAAHAYERAAFELAALLPESLVASV